MLAMLAEASRHTRYRSTSPSLSKSPAATPTHITAVLSPASLRSSTTKPPGVFEYRAGLIGLSAALRPTLKRLLIAELLETWKDVRFHTFPPGESRNCQVCVEGVYPT